MQLSQDRPVVIPLIGSMDQELADWLAPRLEAETVDSNEREVESWEAIAEVRHHIELGQTTIVHGSNFRHPGALEALCAAVLDAGGICVPFYIDGGPVAAKPKSDHQLFSQSLTTGRKGSAVKGGGYDDPDYQTEYQTAYFSEGLPTVIGVRLDGSRPVEENGRQLLSLFS